MAILGDMLEKAKKDRQVNLPVSTLIDQIYSGYVEVDKEKQKKSFSPSGLFYGSGACAARWVISFSKGMYELKASPLQAAGMHQGTLAHERIQKAMVLSKAVKEEHIEIEVKYDDPPILGYADFMVELFGEMYLGEIKTTKHANFEYRRNTNIIANYHLAQMLVYMYILGLTKGIILYESKDTNELHGITFEMTPERREWVEYCLDWCRNVWELHQSGVMPARSFRKNSKVCQSCPVEARCYNESMSDVKIERLKLPS